MLWTTRRSSETFTHSSSSVVGDCQTGNTGQKTCQKHVCCLAGAGQFLNQAHKRCVLLDVSHVPPAIPSVFSYSWSSEKKRVRLRVRPCYLLQSRLSKEERSYHPLAVYFPSSFYSERYTSLQILIRWKCCSTTLCPRSLEKLLTYGFWIEWSGRSTVPVRTRKLCVGIPRRKSERAHFFVFFFRLIGKNQCGRITRNTEKNLPGLTVTNFFTVTSKNLLSLFKVESRVQRSFLLALLGQFKSGPLLIRVFDHFWLFCTMV